MKTWETRRPVAAERRAQNTNEQPLSHSVPVYIPDGTPAYAGTRRVGTWRRDAPGCSVRQTARFFALR